MRSFSSWMDVGLVLYTFDFTNPHRKKSHGVRSGERGGQGMLGDPRPIHLFGIFLFSQSRTGSPQWGSTILHEYDAPASSVRLHCWPKLLLQHLEVTFLIDRGVEEEGSVDTLLADCRPDSVRGKCIDSSLIQ